MLCVTEASLNGMEAVLEPSGKISRRLADITHRIVRNLRTHVFALISRRTSLGFKISLSVFEIEQSADHDEQESKVIGKCRQRSEKIDALLYFFFGVACETSL